MSKIPKEAVLYIHDAVTQYQCVDCIFLKNGNRCAFMGPAVPINWWGGCGLFKQSIVPAVSVPWLGTMTKEQIGYAENKPGFSCKRCEEFILSGDCKKVDKDSPGDDPGEIHKNSCCNRWEADEKRAPMSTPEVLRYLRSSTPEETEEAAETGQSDQAPADLRREL